MLSANMGIKLVGGKIPSQRDAKWYWRAGKESILPFCPFFDMSFRFEQSFPCRSSVSSVSAQQKPLLFIPSPAVWFEIWYGRCFCQVCCPYFSQFCFFDLFQVSITPYLSFLRFYWRSASALQDSKSLWTNICASYCYCLFFPFILHCRA